MGYYLSKSNRDTLELFIPRLRDSPIDFSLEMNRPERLRYIIKNAVQLDEYAWIRKKYIISVIGSRIFFKIRELLLLSEQVEVIGVERTEQMDFFGIVNDLLLNNYDKITYTQANLTLDEIERIKDWCTTNGYLIDYQDNILRVTKKNG